MHWKGLLCAQSGSFSENTFIVIVSRLTSKAENALIGRGVGKLLICDTKRHKKASDSLKVYRSVHKNKSKELQHTVWFSDLYALLMRYGVNFTSYRIKSVYKSLDQTVEYNLFKNVSK